MSTESHGNEGNNHPDIASTENAEAEKRADHPFKVTVTYDGDKKQFEVKPEELVKRLLDDAIKAFGPLPAQHTLALFNVAGDELKDEQTLGLAGVKPHDMLLLRPSKVKGGA